MINGSAPFAAKKNAENNTICMMWNERIFSGNHQEITLNPISHRKKKMQNKSLFMLIFEFRSILYLFSFVQTSVYTINTYMQMKVAVIL